MEVSTKLQIGVQHHRSGRLQSAMVIYEQILNHFPDHPDALHLSGLIAHQLGNSDDAIKGLGGRWSNVPQNRFS
jgi:protein O-GlcNAc transferase